MNVPKNTAHLTFFLWCHFACSLGQKWAELTKWHHKANRTPTNERPSALQGKIEVTQLYRPIDRSIDRSKHSTIPWLFRKAISLRDYGALTKAYARARASRIARKEGKLGADEDSGKKAPVMMRPTPTFLTILRGHTGCPIWSVTLGRFTLFWLFPLCCLAA